jgi:hypothetical protein
MYYTTTTDQLLQQRKAYYCCTATLLLLYYCPSHITQSPVGLYPVQFSAVQALQVSE